MERVERATLVLFGGTGDLATRKLLPALFNLWKQDDIRACAIVGIGRKCETTEQYHALLAEHVDVAAAQPEDWARFVESVEFHHGEIGSESDFSALGERLDEIEKRRGLAGNRLFYYAVGPRWFAPITERLAAAGLISRPARGDRRWTRIVVEKPFGTDRASATELDRALHRHADEDQIYRIDHYLGKETVQNLIAFRFANALIEPIWNRRYVDHVQITVAESVGVGTRAGYYERSGALRDMMQNHMLQLLALTAMEPPIGMDPDAIRDEKVKVLRAIRLPANAAEVAASTVRGQYGAGAIDGASVVGYRDEPGVDATSTTPTFIAARLYLDTWRWADVPFLMRHGKRLARRATEIAIQFRTPPLALFRDTNIPGECRNLLIVRIQPDEGISLRLSAKEPGAGMKIGTVKLDFSYSESFRSRIPDAYERLLLDAMVGDPTLFTRADEVQTMWRWADTLLAGWDELDSPVYPNYGAGSWGPPAAEQLFPAAKDVGPDSCPIGWRRL